jgi:hypothetical protein
VVDKQRRCPTNNNLVVAVDDHRIEKEVVGFSKEALSPRQGIQHDRVAAGGSWWQLVAAGLTEQLALSG